MSASRPSPQLLRARAQVGAWAGMAAAVLFVTVFTVEGWLRPDYSPASMFVSELSLGPRGWVQVASFLVTGALVVVLGRGLAAVLRGGATASAGPILLQIIGVSLFASGLFATDPSALRDQLSVQGVVHGVFGALVFSFAPISCFVLYRRFRRDAEWRGLAGWTLAVGVGLALTVLLLGAAEQPESDLFSWKGLVQRLFLVGFMGWLFTVAARLRSLSLR